MDNSNNNNNNNNNTRNHTTDEGNDAASTSTSTNDAASTSTNDVHPDFGRLARRLVGASIGLVFGGGGAKGAAHLAVIRAMEENKIPIDMVGGVSIGALVAAMVVRPHCFHTYTLHGERGLPAVAYLGLFFWGGEGAVGSSLFSVLL